MASSLDLPIDADEADRIWRASLPAGKVEAWLSRKNTEKKVLGKSRWEKFYAVFDPDLWSVRFYLSESDYFNDDSVGEISLQQLRSVHHLKDKKGGKRFNVMDYNNVEHQLLTHSTEDTAKWLGVFQPYVEAPLPRFSVSHADTSAVAGGGDAPKQPEPVGPPQSSTGASAPPPLPQRDEDEEEDYSAPAASSSSAASSAGATNQTVEQLSEAARKMKEIARLSREQADADAAAYEVEQQAQPTSESARKMRDIAEASRKKAEKDMALYQEKIRQAGVKMREIAAASRQDAAAAIKKIEEEEMKKRQERYAKMKKPEPLSEAAKAMRRIAMQSRDKATTSSGLTMRQIAMQSRARNPSVTEKPKSGLDNFASALDPLTKVKVKKKDPIAAHNAKVPRPLERRYTDKLDPLVSQAVQGKSAAPALPAVSEDKSEEENKFAALFDPLASGKSAKKPKTHTSSFELELGAGDKTLVTQEIDRASRTTHVKWTFTIKDAQQVVELFHGRVWGRRTILHNGQWVHDSRQVLDKGSTHELDIQGVQLIAQIKHKTFKGSEYLLYSVANPPAPQESVLEQSISESEYPDEPEKPAAAAAPSSDAKSDDAPPPAVPEQSDAPAPLATDDADAPAPVPAADDPPAPAAPVEDAAPPAIPADEPADEAPAPAPAAEDDSPPAPAPADNADEQNDDLPPLPPPEE